MKLANAGMDRFRFLELRLFLEVSQEGSLREVARKNRMEVARLSKVIKKLEAVGGSPLFLRSSQGMSLTPAGEEFQRLATPILNSIDEMGRSPAKKEGKQDETYAIAAPSFIQAPMLSRVVPELLKEFETSRFRLITMGQDQLISSGIRGIFKIAVHVGELDWPRSWNTLRLGKFRSALYANNESSIPRSLESRQLRRYPFVVPIHWIKNRIYHGADDCPMKLQDRTIGLEVSTASLALELITKTDQLAFLPEVVAQSALEAGLVKKIEVRDWPESATPIFLSVRGDQVPQKFHRALVTGLKNLL